MWHTVLLLLYRGILSHITIPVDSRLSAHHFPRSNLSQASCILACAVTCLVSSALLADGYQRSTALRLQSRERARA